MRRPQGARPLGEDKEVPALREPRDGPGQALAIRGGRPAVTWARHLDPGEEQPGDGVLHQVGRDEELRPAPERNVVNPAIHRPVPVKADVKDRPALHGRRTVYPPEEQRPHRKHHQST